MGIKGGILEIMGLCGSVGGGNWLFLCEFYYIAKKCLTRDI